MTSPIERPKAAVVMSAIDPRQGAHEAQVSREELESLLAGLGIEVAERFVYQRRAARLLGAGKREELAALLTSLAPREVLLAVDAALEPRVQAELERALNVEVIDRTGVVLQVFERRARTRLAQAEIELARLRYELPRLREDTAKDDRVGGGGRGGRGHTNLELSRQAMRERQVQLTHDLQKLRSVRDTQTERRREQRSIALVGYTNAGKSSLFRALTGAQVHVKDALFATLEATVRQLAPQAAPRVLVSDTVGFVRNLPHDLVRSFQSTLEEALAADLLLLVVDASDPEFRSQLAVTEETLAAVGAHQETLLILNKLDRVASREALMSEFPEALWISTRSATDVDQVRAAVLQYFRKDWWVDTLRLPFAEVGWVSELREHAVVLTERYDEDGVLVEVAAPQALLDGARGLPTEPPRTPEELLLRASHLGYEALPLGPLTQLGADFVTLAAEHEDGRAVMLRAPARAEAHAALQRELRALSLLAPRLPVATPRYELRATAVSAYERLPGVPLCSPDGSWAVDPAAPPPALLDELARLIVRLQQSPVAEAARSGLGLTPISELRARYTAALDRVEQQGAAQAEELTRLRVWLSDDAGWPASPVLVHGRLIPSHLLIDQGRLVGVTSFSEVRLSDPSLDLMPLLHEVHEGFGAQLTERLVALGALTWEGWLQHTAMLSAFTRLSDTTRAATRLSDAS